MFSKGPSSFVLCLESWGFGFSTALGSPASVIEQVMTSQEYIKVEHVRTSLLSSSFAKFAQFRSERFFFKFSLV